MENFRNTIHEVVINSLTDARRRARTMETKARNAYPNSAWSRHTGALADAHGMAAKAYDDALAEYELMIRQEESNG